MSSLYKVLSIAGIFAFSSVFGQNLSTHYQYQLNWFNINPAFAGSSDGVTAMINAGTQWVGMDGNPNNSMFGVYSRYKENMGLGGKVIVDSRGNFNNFSAEGVYSYGVKFAENQNLHFGVTLGLYQSKLNINNFINDENTDASDPTINQLYYDESSFLSGFGALYVHGNLELGISAPHLMVSGRQISDHIFAMLRYKADLGESNLSLTPSVVHQNLSASPSITDMGLRLGWNNVIWAQYVHRTNDIAVISSGFKANNFSFGYAYSMARGDLSKITGGGHEIIISMRFFKKEKEAIDMVEDLDLDFKPEE